MKTWTMPTPIQEIPETLVSPVPFIGRFSRWIFQLPSWLQIVGTALLLVAAILLFRFLWKNRRRIEDWIRSRSRGLQIGMAVTVGAGLLLLSFAGVSGIDYTQHSNDFCTSCHVMDSAYSRFAVSEHADRGCHDCHQQPVSASLRQVYSWVLERPSEVGPHAPVANEVCANCHITLDPDSTWQRISATAGHRVHLESDSSALEDVQCVDCHGVEVHRFVPSTDTCGQSECHGDRETMPLGEMVTDTTSLHCVLCHQFTGEVDESGPRTDSFTGLVPALDDCSSCHEMQEVLGAYDVELDPHEGSCGSCHNPHEHELPVEALASCSNSGCHENPEETSPFHRDQHALVADCTDCHDAHTWVAPTECLSCHTRMP